MNGVKIIDQIEFANAHPNGETPFGRDEYINKMKILNNNIIPKKEKKIESKLHIKDILKKN